MISLLALVATAAALVALSLGTARRPEHPVPDFDRYLARWAALHGGYDPRANVWVVGWLRLTYAAGRSLARRGVLPDVITLWGLWFAFAVLVPARAGDRWALLAASALVASALADALDGGVAVLTERTTRWGSVLDSVVDRIADTVYLAALVAVGGLPVVAIAAGFALFLLEYLRVRAGNAGVSEITVVTVGERPTRVVLCVAGILLGGLFIEQAGPVATGALAAVTTVSVIGVGQLGIAVRRRLVSPPG